ncbi:YkgJ family cysteine cluster protein [Gluconacetobacter sacchari]|uniref:YkgJ family cysteine cluster protein n=1 Tax=Gluconacetobacter sacchari TaxID=92759 RepID=UPI0039B3A38C
MSSDSAAPEAASPLAYMRRKMNQADAMFRRDRPVAGSRADLLLLARRILSLCDEVADALPHLSPVVPLACGKGCDTCCHSLVQVNPLFAALAVHEARQTFSPERLHILQERLTSPPSACPFLFDGSCSIYAARPMVCRGYYSLNLDLCRQGEFCEKSLGYQGEHAHAHHQFMIFLFALEKRLEAIEAELGIPGEPVFLNMAARALMDEPAP